MVILVPWKPLAVAWCALAAMLWVGYVGYSVLEGKNPFAMAQRHSSRLQTHSAADNGIRSKSHPDSRGGTSERIGLSSLPSKSGD
jgi:hypothetical protein